jgi:hypothetical protein
VIGRRSGVDHGVGSAAAAEAGVRVILQQLAGELPALGHAHLAKNRAACFPAPNAAESQLSANSLVELAEERNLISNALYLPF